MTPAAGLEPPPAQKLPPCRGHHVSVIGRATLVAGTMRTPCPRVVVRGKGGTSRLVRTVTLPSLSSPIDAADVSDAFSPASANATLTVSSSRRIGHQIASARGEEWVSIGPLPPAGCCIDVKAPEANFYPSEQASFLSLSLLLADSGGWAREVLWMLSAYVLGIGARLFGGEESI